MLLNYVQKNKKIQAVVQDQVKVINQTNRHFNLYAIASDYQLNQRTICVVLPNLNEAQTYYDHLIQLLPEDEVLFYPADELLTSALFVVSDDFKYERINTMIELMKGTPKVVVTHVNGIIRPVFPKERWESFCVELKVGNHVEFSTLRRRLVELGYEHVYTVVKTGQFSVRGSIIDIFPLNQTNPVRLDFFDIELEKIKIFDHETQLSCGEIDQVSIIPMNELFYTDDELQHVLVRFQEARYTGNDQDKEMLDRDRIRLEERDNLDLLNMYLPLFYSATSILDFVDDSKVYVMNYDKMEGIYHKIEMDVESHYAGVTTKLILDHVIFQSLTELERRHTIYCNELVDQAGGMDIGAKALIPYEANFRLLSKEVKEDINVMEIILVLQSLDRMTRIKDFFLEEHINYQTARSIEDIGKGHVSFIYQEEGLPLFLPKDEIKIITEDMIYPKNNERKKVKYKSIFSNATKINKHTELLQGDYVVHYDYGIGRYEGIKTMELSGRMRDYVMVQYHGTDVLYIPVEQIDLIQKYNPREGYVPPLSKLNSGTWEKTKARVRNKVREFSEKLIKLYAERQAAQGFAYPPDTPEQVAFEADFRFEETEDQILAIEAVKKDMESSRPMDRLVCGDVGFGKTEVALRAAFKAVMAGKQVAYLAPTTVLTRQHYHTFRQRMESYGVRVELLNRFVTGKKQTQIIADIAKGLVDVVIGTHRILSKDLVFKDLGLLVTDEEQRFGVMHKERIKEMKVNVDSLVLTATPIPRTLQMSMVGIKELSMIETPPKNRYPIQTYVTQRHDTLIKEAIERELMRDGQVFYMYNYVEDIEDIVVKLHRLVPEAKIRYAHGKMNKNDLEEIISDFIEHQFNVLVCTTIIETGIDIPDTNTLIIHDADRLGLSQLYQLRGRVGRSDRIAYAYLMYEPRKILTPAAEKRLEAIKEFTELGSGFKIAMRDLAIRGAGDILGEEQSGFIDSVGIELYMRILEESLREMQGIQEAEKQKTIYPQVFTDRYIDDQYITSEDVKIEIHNKIKLLTSIHNLSILKLELEDRFGRLTLELLLYMYEKLFQNLCGSVGIEEVRTQDPIVILVMSFEATEKANGEFLFQTACEVTPNIRLRYHAKRIYIDIHTEKYQDNSWLMDACIYLDKIL